MEDRDLVNHFLKRKDKQAFSALYNKYTDLLYRTAYFLVKGDEPEAADIVQETWVVAIEKLNDFQWNAKLSTWLTGILINKWRELLRQNVKKHSEAEKINNYSQQTELKIDLASAIKLLPAGYREVLVLHDLEGFKHKEIAELLSISEGTSKSQLFQARKKMRELIKGYAYER